MRGLALEEVIHMRTTLVPLCLLLTHLHVHGQIILQSGFEDWAGGLPQGFTGTQNTIPLDSISQTDGPVHGGMNAMRLGLGDPVLLTTQGLSVEAYRIYEVRFWVHGSGRIGTRLFDGRSENDGFSPAGPVLEVDTAGWQYVLQRVLATTSTVDAEFVFDLEATGDGSHLIVDDLTINTSTLPLPQAATIAEIQETGEFNGYSPLNFAFVRTHGVVTAIGPNSLFIQDGGGPWSGIEVLYSAGPDLVAGDSIRVIGTVDEFSGQDEPWAFSRTRIIAVQFFERISTGHPLSDPVIVEMGSLADEQWESVLVRVPDLICQNAPDPFDFDWPAGNDQGSLLVDDLLYYHYPTIGATYTISGIALYAGDMVLLPRFEADIELMVSVEERMAERIRVYPNPAHDRVTLSMTGMGAQRYQLIDPQGRVVEEGMLARPVGHLGVGHLAPGTYVLRTGKDGPSGFARIVIR